MRLNKVQPPSLFPKSHLPNHSNPGEPAQDTKTQPPGVASPMPLTFVTRSPSDPEDTRSTQELLLHCQSPGGYKCPKCSIFIPDPEKMINHLSEEINSGLKKLNDLSYLPLSQTPKDADSTPLKSSITFKDI